MPPMHQTPFPLSGFIFLLIFFLAYIPCQPSQTTEDIDKPEFPCYMDAPIRSRLTDSHFIEAPFWNGGPAESRDQSTPGLGNVSYSYDAAGKHYGCADIASFDDRSQNAYFTAFHNSPGQWAAAEDFEFTPQYQEQVEVQGLYSRPLYEAEYRLSYQVAEAAAAVECSGRYDSALSSSKPEAHEALAFVLAPEESYQIPLTPFANLSTPDAEPRIVPSLSSTPTPMPHLSLLPDQHSTYSELSANLAYMAALSSKRETTLPKEKRSIVERRRKDKMAVKTKEKLHKRTLEGPDVASSTLIPAVDWSRKEKKREGNCARSIGEPRGEEALRIHMPIPLLASGSKPETANKPQPQKIPPPGAFRRGNGSGSSGSGSGKKLGLACLFCRERKIACGRPSELNPDQTCNQCARRLFKCEYPTESRRGQHKRPKNKPDVT